MKAKISDIVLGSLVADTYSLGAHWIYDKNEIENSTLNWDGLNAPLASWHDTKDKGDFTHYGDQLVCFYDYVLKNESYDSAGYIKVWQTYMETYTGYIDGATKNTLENLSLNKALPCGSSSTDLSVVGRIAPLLKMSQNEEEFLNNVDSFVCLTHNSDIVKQTASFFAQVLWQVYNDDKSILECIKEVKKSSGVKIKVFVDDALNCRLETTDALNSFGLACSVTDGFSGVIFLLNKYENDFETALIQNAKAGGDSSARGMIIAMLMVAAYGSDIIPNNWCDEMNYSLKQ